MEFRNPSRIRSAALALAVPGAFLLSLAHAAANDAIEERYQQERAACARRETDEDRANCLREAAAARNAARQGELEVEQRTYEQNVLARCEVLPASEQDLCRRRTRGEGVTKGSVEEGGIYREYREITLPSAKPQAEAAPGTPGAQTPQENK